MRGVLIQLLSTQTNGTFGFCLSIATRFDNKQIRSCLASRRSVSGWGHVTHGARALQPNGFRFRFIPRKVPGLSANPLGYRDQGTSGAQKAPVLREGGAWAFTPAPASRGRASADAPETRNYARVDCPVVVILGQVALVLLRLHFCYR